MIPDSTDEKPLSPNEKPLPPNEKPTSPSSPKNDKGEDFGNRAADGVKNSDMVSSAGETVGKKVASTVLTPNLEETAQAAKTTGLKPGNGSRK